MSVSFGCTCPERKKPVKERAWRVVNRYCNYSAFNGYHYTPSEWSHIVCLECGASGRTKAKYVAALPDITDEEYGIKPTVNTPAR